MEVDNYRPITLLNTTFKWLTTAITHRLSSILEKRNMISDLQNGFRTGRSTKGNIRTLLNLLEHAKMTKSEIHLCYIDFKKAFDSISYDAIKDAMAIHLNFHEDDVKLFWT